MAHVTHLDFQMVIARYQENLSWTRLYAGMRLLYDKGQRPAGEAQGWAPSRHDKYQRVSNEGLECVPYLRYVLDYYDNLPEYVGFTQASLDPLHKWIRPDYGPRMFLNMLDEARHNGCSKPLTSKTTDAGDWGFAYNGTQTHETSDELHKRYTKVSRLGGHNFGQWFRNVVHLTPNRTWETDHFHFYPSALMMVSRSRILSRRKVFYRKMLRQVDYATKPLECQYFERAWYYVFNCDKSAPR